VVAFTSKEKLNSIVFLHVY